MLTHLTIKDYLLVDTLNLDMPKGFTAITGETGAGKSILLKAIALALGERADAKAIRTGAEQAVISLEFETDNCNDLLKEHGIDITENLHIRRIVTKAGKSRAFLNGEPVASGFLKTLSPYLVDIQGQFASRALLEPAGHGVLLDTGCGLGDLAQIVEQAFQQWQQTIREQRALEESFEKAVRDREYLEHANEELKELAPELGEEERLSEKRNTLMQRQLRLALLDDVLSTLNPKGDTDRRLVKAQQVLASSKHQTDEMAEIMAYIEQASLQLGEAQSILETLLNEPMDDEDEPLDQVEERLFALRDAARKYRVLLDDLPSLQRELAEKLELINDHAKRLKAVQAQCKAFEKTFREQATVLSAKRKQAGTKLAKAVNNELTALHLPKAKFRVDLEVLPPEQWGSFGAERVIFMVKTNPGLPEGAIHKTASGGELTRLLLALKVALVSGSNQPQPLMIFDEVDVGTGGAVATSIGERLFSLSKKSQVISITHSPQVAALAQQHWHMGKTQNIDETRTQLTVLEGEERQEELARMLSGATVTDAARDTAENLLKRA